MLEVTLKAACCVITGNGEPRLPIPVSQEDVGKKRLLNSQSGMGIRNFCDSSAPERGLSNKYQE